MLRLWPLHIMVAAVAAISLLVPQDELRAQSGTKEPPSANPPIQTPNGTAPVPATKIEPAFEVVPIVGTPCPLDPPAPVVVIRVRVAACSPADREICYKICVENLSPAAAHHVLVRNPMPANAAFVRAYPQPQMSRSELLWSVGTLPGQSRCFIDLVLQPLGAGDVLNCARVQFEHGQCVLTRVVGASPQFPLAPGQIPPGTIQPPPGKEQPPPVPIKPKDEKKPDVRLKLEISGPAQALVGAQVAYKITLANEGADPASKSLISIVRPEKMEYVNSSEGGKYANDVAAWFLGTIDPGKQRSVTVTYKATAAGEICPLAKGQADFAADVSARICTTFKGVSAVVTRGWDTIDPIVVGEQTSYKIEVKNQGTVPVTNIQVRALLPAGKMSFVSADAEAKHQVSGTVEKGQEITFAPLSPLSPGAAARYEIRVKGEAAGKVIFRAEITADQLKDGGPVIEQESTRIEAPASAEGPVILKGIINP